MGSALPIDRLIGERLPSLATAEDVARIEAVPFDERIAAASTYDAIRIGAAISPDAPAIQFLPNADPAEPARVVTHAQFAARVTQAANAFHSLGVGPGDVVSLLLPLLPQSLYGLFGAEAAGIANPVNPLLEAHQIAEILAAAGTTVLVALGPTEGSDIWQKVERIRESLPGLKAILRVGGTDAPRTAATGAGTATAAGEAGGPTAPVHDFDALVATMPADRLVSGRRIAADDTAAYFHTGGTTGLPKLVRHTHRNQVYQAWVINLMVPAPGRPLLFGLPLFHVGGALTQALSTFAAGGSLVVLSPAGWRNASAVRNLWKLVERFRPAVFSAVPTVLTAAAGVPPGEADTSSLRCMAGGGSAIPVAIGEVLQQRFGIPVLEVYGMTETASVHTISYADRPVRLGTAGHPVPYSRVRIVRRDGDGPRVVDCATDEIGVVAMAGPGVFGGYLNDVHNRHAFVEPGWVDSGDLGRLDAQGYLWITGRAKDLIIRGGHNIDPMPIEELIYQHPAVALAAVVGQPDAYAGELPLAYVQLKPGATTTDAELLGHLRERTPERAAVPVRVILVDSIPLTGVGKVFKPSLRWDAARRVFAEQLAPLERAGVRLSVAVGSHGTHGSLATVTVAGVAPADRDAFAGEVRERFASFVIRHELQWSDE